MSPLARKSAILVGVRRRHPVFLPCQTRVEALFGALSGSGLCGAFWNLRASLEPRSRDRVRLAWRPVRICDTPFPSAAAQASDQIRSHVLCKPGLTYTPGADNDDRDQRGIRAKISLNPRSHLQHIQRPTPSHLSKNTPSLQGVGRADVA